MNKSNHAKSKIVLDQDKFKEKNINTNTDTKIGENNKIKDHYDDLNPDFKITQINTHRISIEYLKNVFSSYLDRRNRHLFGHEMNLMTISKLNHALHTHSTKKKASWALVWALSSVLDWSIST